MHRLLSTCLGSRLLWLVPCPACDPPTRGPSWLPVGPVLFPLSDLSAPSFRARFSARASIASRRETDLESVKIRLNGYLRDTERCKCAFGDGPQVRERSLWRTREGWFGLARLGSSSSLARSLNPSSPSLGRPPSLFSLSLLSSAPSLSWMAEDRGDAGPSRSRPSLSLDIAGSSSNAELDPATHRPAPPPPPSPLPPHLSSGPGTPLSTMDPDESPAGFLSQHGTPVTEQTEGGALAEGGSLAMEPAIPVSTVPVILDQLRCRQGREWICLSCRICGPGGSATEMDRGRR